MNVRFIRIFLLKSSLQHPWAVDSPLETVFMRSARYRSPWVICCCGTSSFMSLAGPHNLWIVAADATSLGGITLKGNFPVSLSVWVLYGKVSCCEYGCHAFWCLETKWCKLATTVRLYRSTWPIVCRWQSVVDSFLNPKERHDVAKHFLTDWGRYLSVCSLECHKAAPYSGGIQPRDASMWS